MDKGFFLFFLKVFFFFPPSLPSSLLFLSFSFPLPPSFLLFLPLCSLCLSFFSLPIPPPHFSFSQTLVSRANFQELPVRKGAALQPRKPIPRSRSSRSVVSGSPHTFYSMVGKGAAPFPALPGFQAPPGEAFHTWPIPICGGECHLGCWAGHQLSEWAEDLNKH